MPDRRPDPHRNDGSVSLGGRLDAYDRWMQEHDKKDDERFECLMEEVTSFKVDRGKAMGFAIAFGALATLMGIISACASIYAAFKP